MPTGRLRRQRINRWAANVSRLMATSVLHPSPRSRIVPIGHPLQAMLLPIPFFFFGATLVTDIAYWRSANMQWANMSAWLLTVGLLISVLAVLVGVVDFLSDARVRRLRPGWLHVAGNLAALALATLNAFIHTRDAYTSVVPTGLLLSALTVLLLVLSAWNGWTKVYGYRVDDVAGRTDAPP
jgi:uncharacterized membrane protein